jgi:hypothetical protein
MTVQIQGFDITGNWSITRYSIQKGDIVKFWIEHNQCKIQKIRWKFCDGLVSKELDPSHIFRQLDSITACEGDVWVSAKITFQCDKKCDRCNKVIRVKKRLLIIPRLRGDIQATTPVTTENMHSINLVANPLMEAPQVSTPFMKNPDTQIFIPESEIKCTDVIGTNITKYGVHTLGTTCTIIYKKIPFNMKSIEYFKDNYPNNYGRFQPIMKKYMVYPINVSLSTLDYNVNTDVVLKLNNVSKYMLPDTALIQWNIDGNITVKYGSITLPYHFSQTGMYHVQVQILIPYCDAVIFDQDINVV